MQVCCFLEFTPRESNAQPVDTSTHADLAAFIGTIPLLDRAILHVPAEADDPYLGKEGAPPLSIQLYFDEIGALEAQMSKGGALQALADPARFAQLTALSMTQQVMLVRASALAPSDVAQARAQLAACSYLVSYMGSAPDMNAWLGHYLDHHVPLMGRFPGIRAVEVYTRVDWRSGLACPRVDAMQRNKVVFDSPDALDAALQSPIRHEMRRDFKTFPAFEGPSPHHPVLSTTVLGPRA
jgi:uncharacterized protein (TIGR02118 family)